MTAPAGFIGLGRIGRPMALRLVDWPGGLSVHDLDPAATAELEQRGASVTSTPRELAARAELISIMVRDDAQVRAVVGELLTAARGTRSSATSARLARRTSSWPNPSTSTSRSPGWRWRGSAPNSASVQTVRIPDDQSATRPRQDERGLRMEHAGRARRLFAITRDHLFGEIWTRPGLTTEQRRLVLIGALAATGCFDILDVQLDSALRLGELDVTGLRELVIFLAHYAGRPTAAVINTQVEKLITRHEGSPAPG